MKNRFLSKIPKPQTEWEIPQREKMTKKKLNDFLDRNRIQVENKRKHVEEARKIREIEEEIMILNLKKQQKKEGNFNSFLGRMQKDIELRKEVEEVNKSIRENNETSELEGMFNPKVSTSMSFFSQPSRKTPSEVAHVSALYKTMTQESELDVFNRLFKESFIRQNVHDET